MCDADTRRAHADREACFDGDAALLQVLIRQRTKRLNLSDDHINQTQLGPDR